MTFSTLTPALTTPTPGLPLHPTPNIFPRPPHSTRRDRFLQKPRSFRIFDRLRRRSVAFLEREGETWACFLVTFRGQDGRWYGYFSFRPKDGEFEEDEVRTADIFREASEGEIDHKARSLGRPLLSGLLASALHIREDSVAETPKLRRWFRSMLTENSQGLAGDWPQDENGAVPEPDLGKLKSLYASYRLDQVCHLIALVKPEDFEGMVSSILEGEPIDFASKDVLQFAMMVVEFIDNLIPLPPFDTWAQDFIENQGIYALYSHTLHREGRLP